MKKKKIKQTKNPTNYISLLNNNGIECLIMGKTTDLRFVERHWHLS